MPALCSFLSPERWSKYSTLPFRTGSSNGSFFTAPAVVCGVVLAAAGVTWISLRLLFEPTGSAANVDIDFADADAARVAFAAKAVKERLERVHNGLETKTMNHHEAEEEITRLLIQLDSIVVQATEAKQRRAALVRDVITEAELLKVGTTESNSYAA